MTHKVNSKGVAIEHPPKINDKREKKGEYKEKTNRRTGSVQLGPEKRYTHSDWKTGLFRSEQTFYTFAQAKKKGLVTKEYKKAYNKKLERAKNKPEMFDAPGLTLRQIKSIIGGKRHNWKVSK
tara:strand:+ start:50 stop:418 length:369 start_codon:yes stop_codon:yes gene_type:complete